jgi:diguanylate cyclase (GGDEF)-like protein/PAS domain S-box-containing protein
MSNDNMPVNSNAIILSEPLLQKWPDGLLVLDNKGTIVEVNQQLCSMLGYAETELSGRVFHSVLCGQAADYQHEEAQCPFSQIEEHLSIDDIIDVWLVQKNGVYLHVDVRYLTYLLKEHQYHVLSLQDTSRRRYSEKELQRLALFAELNPAPIVEFNEQGLIYFSNPAMIELIAEADFDINGLPNVLPRNTKELIRRCLTTGQTMNNIEVEYDGRWYLWNFHPVLERSLVQGYGLEITARKESEKQLFEEKERFLVTLEAIEDAVITVDNDECITYVNPKATELCGWTNIESLGRPFKQIISLFNTETRAPTDNLVRMSLDQNTTFRYPSALFLAHRDGYVVAVKQMVSPMLNQAKQVIGAVIALHDITDARKMEQSLTYQATHDTLTGLINRSEFENRLRQSIDRSKTDKLIQALLYLDLDNFKIVNDTCGHVAGDQLLCQITSQLEGKLRRGDVLARLGGDEFGAILEGCPVDRATLIANELCAIIQNYEFIWDNHRFQIGVSIGLVPINEDCHDVNQLLSLADSCCYAAKDLGRNRVHVYQEDDVDVMKKKGEMQWVTRINKALQEDRFVLYFQIITPIDSEEQGLHFEILIRMKDEHGNIIPPGDFLPAAEHYGIVKILDHWVIRTMFTWLNEHPEVAEQVKLCSINLSGNSIGDEHFMHHLTQDFKHCMFSPEKICFEVTETAAIQNLSVASLFFDTIKELGCSFSLDDFGSGMSSFGYLKQLNIDYLKIDGLFVKDIVIDPVDAAMVRSINEVGHMMGLKTIAEYVENQEIMDVLKDIGVDFAQGYGVRRPEPLSELPKLISRKK